MTTTAKRLSDLEDALNQAQAGEKLPFIVLWSVPGGEPGVYWRDHDRTGEPLTELEIAEIERTHETVILVNYEEGKIREIDDERSNFEVSTQAGAPGTQRQRGSGSGPARSEINRDAGRD
jgi:hypothetical protein